MSSLSEFQFSTLFGKNLTNGKSTVDTDAALKGKHVMIYFSAHWCPPCRGFTPQLVTFYNTMKKSNNDFELVFASSDKDDKQFNEYYETMPWLAVPFSDRDQKNKLSKMYKVSGIPTLVVVGPDGNLITTDGRTGVASDPTGSEFPWKPKSITELISGNVIGKGNVTVDSSSFDNKNLMLYFSAHWCPPCRQFTPELVKTYNKLKENVSGEMECLFVSADKDDDSFNEYFGEMPWLSLDFKTTKKEREAIGSNYDIQGYPSLVVLGPKKGDGSRDVINGNARGASNIKNVDKFPWFPEKFANLSDSVECNGGDINDFKSVIVLCEAGDDDEQEEIKKAVQTAAEKLAGSGDDKVLFYYATSNEGVVGRIRDLCKLGKVAGDVQMIMLDIPEGGKYYVSTEDDITAENIEKFLKNPGEKRQMQM